MFILFSCLFVINFIYSCITGIPCSIIYDVYVFPITVLISCFSNYSFYQELLTYLAMFVKTHPVLFDGMLQVRIGLIMEVMAAEYARTTGLTGKKDAFFSTTFTFLCNSCIFTQAIVTSRSSNIAIF